MENTKSTQPIIDININDTEKQTKKKQILVTIDDNNIIASSKLYHILNDLIYDKVIMQYETLDFIIETKTFDIDYQLNKSNYQI